MRLLFILTFLSCFSTLKAQVQAFLPEVFGDYLLVRDLAMSDDEVYFTIQSLQNEISAIAYFTVDKGKKSKVEVCNFSGQYIDLEPFLSPDGRRLYFVSKRPVPNDTTGRNDHNIWYVERESDSGIWSDPIYMPLPVNTIHNEFYPAVGNSGNLYFTSDRPSSLGEDDLFVAILNDSTFTSVENLGTAINSAGYEYNAYVSPDESVLIFGAYNREDGMGSGDLYISFKDANGVWSMAENAGDEINSPQMDYCPFYNFSDSTLYFTSKRTAIQNVSEEARDIQEILSEINRYDNGLSRIYKVRYSW
jgi:Tol biopolymer transport system component